LIPLICLPIVGGRATADVLITKGGSKYQGIVAEQETNYVVFTFGGSRMTLPKTYVQRIASGNDGAETEIDGAAASKARQAILPLGEKWMTVRKAVDGAMTRIGSRCKQERDSSVDEFAVFVAKHRLVWVQQTINDMRTRGAPGWEMKTTLQLRVEKTPRGPQATNLVMEVTQQTAAKVMADAKLALQSAQRPSEEVLRRQAGELAECAGEFAALRTALTNGAAELEAAKRTLESHAASPNEFQAKLEKCESRLIDLLESCTKTSALLEAKYVPQQPAPAASGGSPSHSPPRRQGLRR